MAQWCRGETEMTGKIERRPKCCLNPPDLALQDGSSILANTFRCFWTFPFGQLNGFSARSPTSAELFFGWFCLFRLRIFQRVEILPDVLWACLNAPCFWIFADTIRRFPKVSWMFVGCFRTFWDFFGRSGTLQPIVVDFFGVWWVYGSRG